MKKKLIGIFTVMLLISSAMTMILFTDTVKVEASGEGQQSYQNIGLDFDFVLNMTDNFSKVIYRTDWSSENNIPKGRCWATEGENYTIAQILKPNMNGLDKPCGLSEYKELSIGYIGQFPFSLRQYSSKIVIRDYNLTIHNGEYIKYIPYSEMFPLGKGCGFEYNMDDENFSFEDTKIIEKDMDTWGYIQDHVNVSCTLLNTFSSVAGPVIYLNTTDSVPENHDCVFILNEEPASEEKLGNLSDALGCILIEDESKGYNFSNSSQFNYAIVNVSGTDSNFSSMIDEIKNGSVYFVDNIQDNMTLVFSNYSNSSCLSECEWVAVFKLKSENDFCTNIFSAHLALWNQDPTCKGAIMYSYNDSTHFMSHTVRDWSWFNIYYTNRFPLPILSINGTVGTYLIENKNNIRVDGWINQTYKKQIGDDPGVTSHNVVAYRNITKSPNNAIVVLSNRMDGWYGETPGDSGVGGAILLGIAKYLKDNNITPKYNLTFLFTTGEEYGMRGAQHYADSHPNNEYNFIQWIGFDQLGFHFPPDEKHTFNMCSNNPTIREILNEIETQTNYETRTHNQYYYETTPQEGAGAEDYVWNDYGVNTILFEKDGGWGGHHQVGENFSIGDSLNYIDQNDVNVTFELAWNVTKYFTVNPDCWFSNISFTSFDSPNDGDTLNDSIRANFTIHSILPSDKVRVELNLSVTTGGVQFNLTNAGHNDYTLTSRSQNESIVFTIPDVVSDGYFSTSLNLYNSTGLINRIVYGSPGYNDSSNFSEWYHLYHPLGYTKVGNSEQSVENRICGSVFTANENGWADNITAFINQIYMSPGPYQCMLYRASDGVLIGNTTSDWVSLPQGNPASSAWWAVFNFTGQKPYLVNGTQYVITCWGNNSNSNVSYTDSGLSSTGRYANQTYDDVPPSQVNFSNEAKFYSIYCSYTPVSPMISNVTATPHTVGFGYNVTITADVFDNESGISQVKVYITPPGEIGTNYTMTHESGDTYYYIYNHTWITGQYNFTIWAISNQSHMNTSSGHHFHVSADATISIATLQDTYSGEDYINITDPPNPPENLTLVARGLTWDNYYNAVTGGNILEVSTGPINYQDDNGTWTPINTTINQLTMNHPAYVYGYRTGNNQGLYGAYFKANIQNDWPVAFTYSRSDDPTVYAVRSKLLGVGYVDPASNWSYQYLQNVQSSQAHTNGNIITYENVFNGTNVTWTYDHTGLKEKIILSNATKTVLASHPPSHYGLQNESSYLVIITKLEHQNLNLYNTSGVLSGNVTVNGTIIDFKDALGQIKCALPLGEAYELNNESVRQNLTYRIIHLNGNTYLLSGLKISDLTAMTFPVVVDPTIIVNTSTNDGFLYRSGSNYSSIWSAEEGAVSSDDDYISIGQTKAEPFSYYNIFRGFLFFDTSELPTNADIMNATLSIYKKNDYSSTDFMITVQNGQPSYPHDPLEEGDYNEKYYSGNGSSLNTASFMNGTNNITLTNLSWITAGDITKFCLRSNRDINGTIPTGAEYVTISSANIQGEPNPDPRPKLIITYRNQSKIKNTGSTDIKGYLLMQVQYYDTGQFPPHWIVDNDVVNETWPRTITIGNQLALDIIFNDMIRASDLTHGEGLYRVYTAFRDPEGNILRTDDAVELDSWWQFNKI